MWLFSDFLSTKFSNAEIRTESIAVVYKLASFISYSRNGEVA